MDAAVPDAVIGSAKREGRPATGRPSFQGRIVPTEIPTVKTFLAKSYEPKKGGVKEFFVNKWL
jgi:hypothetical protein